ncbi:hypothetical protein HDV05_007518 [Chytridiales sp. JEL 0842]|nr:hypothetical protein HDV05_007518 [Chytridiales sp. JEL 0842]
MKGVVSLPVEKLNGAGLRVLIVRTRWNIEIVDAVTEGTKQMLLAHNVEPSNITIKEVPGAYELPFAVQSLLKQGQYDAAVAIGVLIKGETMHFEYIADATTQGLMRVGLDTGVPVIFGVLTCLTEEQACVRAGIGKGENKGHNHGEDYGKAAIEMALLNKGKR